MKDKLIIYPEFDSRIERDYMYNVSVTQGNETASLPVYNHTEDSRVDRNPVDGRRADEYRRFSTFAFEGAGVRVDIKVNRDFHDYAVMPSAKNFRHGFKDGVISVFLDRPDYFLIRLDGKDHTILSVIADEPEKEIPEAGEKTVVVDKWQEVEGGILELTEPETTLYIPAGSVLNARVRVLADNCRIIGRGAIVDPVGDIYRYSAKELDTGVVLLVKAVNNTLIDGIHMLDSKAFNIEFVGVWQEKWAVGNTVRNTKIFSTQMSSDGITCCYYSKDTLAEHCFIYCADNALVYEDGAHYKDVTIGTTCNALFPQTDVRDSSVEDAYIFRADEGIINCEYGGEDNIVALENHTVKNLNAVDITYTPYFFYVENPASCPAVPKRGGMTVENVWLPKLADTRTNSFYHSIAGGDYAVTLKNISLGGELVTEITRETVGGRVEKGVSTFKYLTDGGFEPKSEPNRRTVEYKNGINVFVGVWQVYFENPIIRNGDGILLPTEQLKAELRTDCGAADEIIGGVGYTRLDGIVGAGMAKAVDVKDNAVIITPNENTGNLLLPDAGIVSKYTEYICYASHLVVLNEDGECVYRIINSIKHKAVGIFRIIKEEIQKYGEGVYRLSFETRANEGERLKAAVLYGACAPCEKLFDTSGDWKKCCMDIDIGAEQLGDERIAFAIGCDGESAVDVFDFKNIALNKIK